MNYWRTEIKVKNGIQIEELIHVYDQIIKDKGNDQYKYEDKENEVTKCN
jgi:hypothetical protein